MQDISIKNLERYRKKRKQQSIKDENEKNRIKIQYTLPDKTKDTRLG